MRSRLGELAIQLAARLSAREHVLESAHNAGDLIRRFMRKFQAEVMDAGLAPGAQMQGGLLGLRAEYSVATAYVRQHGMGAAGWVAELYDVTLARSAAIAVARAGGKKAREDAVFGMEDGQVLERDCFDRARADLARQRRHLLGVQLVRGRQTREAKLKEQIG